MQAFFVKDYMMNHPEDGDKIGRLRELMFEQVSIDSSFNTNAIYFTFPVLCFVLLPSSFATYILREINSPNAHIGKIKIYSIRNRIRN